MTFGSLSVALFDETMLVHSCIRRLIQKSMQTQCSNIFNLHTCIHDSRAAVAVACTLGSEYMVVSGPKIDVEMPSTFARSAALV